MELLNNATVIALPHMKNNDSRKIINDLKDKTMDIEERFNSGSDYSAINKLSKQLNGR